MVIKKRAGGKLLAIPSTGAASDKCECRSGPIFGSAVFAAEIGARDNSYPVDMRMVIG